MQLFVSLQRQTDKVKPQKRTNMKTQLLLSLALVMLSVSGCRVNLGDGAEIIEPSEKIVKAKYPQASFNKVENQTVGDIQLIQSDQSRVTLSAPENYIDLFAFENEDGMLRIKYAKNNVNIHSANVTILVYTPTLQEIRNTGAADIRLDNLKTENLEVRNTGVGSFNLKNLEVRKIDVSCSGVGSIVVSGQTDEAKYTCSGVGSINAKELKAQEVEASISGVGGVECHASEAIKGNISGVGGLKFAGHPAKKDLHHSMTGGFTEL